MQESSVGWGAHQPFLVGLFRAKNRATDSFVAWHGMAWCRACCNSNNPLPCKVEQGDCQTIGSQSRREVATCCHQNGNHMKPLERIWTDLGWSWMIFLSLHDIAWYCMLWCRSKFGNVWKSRDFGDALRCPNMPWICPIGRPHSHQHIFDFSATRSVGGGPQIDAAMPRIAQSCRATSWIPLDSSGFLFAFEIFEPGSNWPIATSG